MIGSSPLTRGTLQWAREAAKALWFIPAYAGNTVPGRVLRPSRSVHPRLRGEHPGLGRNIARQVGSSPLTRGTRTPKTATSSSGRFIPAYAGNTMTEVVRMGCWVGSSPLTRGTRIGVFAFCDPQRFIPAYAGNTG